MAGHGDGRGELSGLGYFGGERRIVECNRRMKKFLENGGKKRKEGKRKRKVKGKRKKSNWKKMEK